MQQSFDDRLLKVWEAVNCKSELIYQELYAICTGLEENGRRYGLVRDFSQGMSLFLGKARDEDQAFPMVWEAEAKAKDEQRPPIEQEAAPALQSIPSIAFPSTLPPVPRRKRSHLETAQAETSNPKRKRTT